MFPQGAFFSNEFRDEKEGARARLSEEWRCSLLWEKLVLIYRRIFITCGLLIREENASEGPTWNFFSG
jgi:hypothetical protein